MWTILYPYDGDSRSSHFVVAVGMTDLSETYSVELWQTKMPWPLSLAVHTWFVIEKFGVRDRYEVWATFGKFTGSTVRKNAVLPQQGFRRSFFDDPIKPRKLTVAHCCGSITGREGSDVEKLYTSICQSPENYPWLTRYRLWPGPNSNTYTAYFLKKYPQLTLKLPYTAVGKNWIK